MIQVLLARVVPADRRGVPLRDGRTATIGASSDLGDGERIWLRILTGATSDPVGRGPVIVQIRPADRVAHTMRTAAAAYTDRGWIPAQPPAVLTVDDPPVDRAGPLQAWAVGCVEQYHHRR